MIKFRAYLKERPYLKGTGIIVDVQEINYKYEEIVYENGKYMEVADFKDIILIQSTRLKDVHDSEFFDKDIARDIDSEELGLVEYVNGAFVIKFASGDSVDLYDVKDNFEIIGNQFENRELLEE